MELKHQKLYFDLLTFQENTNIRLDQCKTEHPIPSDQVSIGAANFCVDAANQGNVEPMKTRLAAATATFELLLIDLDCFFKQAEKKHDHGE